MQSLPEFLAARNSLVVDGCLTGESLPLPPDHPLKCPDLMLFGVVQSKDQMAASHLEGLVAGPDSSKTRAAEFLLLREWLSHCSPGLTPSSRTQPTHKYVRCLPCSCALCALLFPSMCCACCCQLCCTQQCSGHPLTPLLLLAGPTASGKGCRQASQLQSCCVCDLDPLPMCARDCEPD